MYTLQIKHTQNALWCKVLIFVLWMSGFLSAFCPRWGPNEIEWIIGGGGGGGKYVSVCKAWGELGGSGGMLSWGNFVFLTF